MTCSKIELLHKIMIPELPNLSKRQKKKTHETDPIWRYWKACTGNVAIDLPHHGNIAFQKLNCHEFIKFVLNEHV